MPSGAGLELIALAATASARPTELIESSVPGGMLCTVGGTMVKPLWAKEGGGLGLGAGPLRFAAQICTTTCAGSAEGAPAGAHGPATSAPPVAAVRQEPSVNCSSPRPVQDTAVDACAQGESATVVVAIVDAEALARHSFAELGLV